MRLFCDYSYRIEKNGLKILGVNNFLGKLQGDYSFILILHYSRKTDYYLWDQDTWYQLNHHYDGPYSKGESIHWAKLPNIIKRGLDRRLKSLTLICSKCDAYKF